MEPTMPTENVFQLALIDLAFQVVEIFFNVVTNVLLPGVLTPLFQAIFSLFTGGTTP